MILKKIILNNIRSYKDETIEFSKGSTLLSGDIGCGKTSILLAIEFALFGLQPGQKGSALLRNGEDSGRIIMDFEVEGNEFSIERTLKRGKAISQDYAAITIGGVKTELAVTELKNKILEILDYPKEFSKKQNILYKFTVYTPQEEMKQIILQDSDTRMNTLRHVFGIDKYKRILENISIITQKLREEKRVNEALISTLGEDKMGMLSKEKELLDMKNKIVFLEKEFLEKQNIRRIIEKDGEVIFQKMQEKTRLEQELEKTKLMILTKKDAINSNERTIRELNEQLKEFEKVIFRESMFKELEEKIQEGKLEKEKLSKINLEIAGEISSLNSKNQESEKLKQKMSNLEICPTCLQDVDSIYRSNILNKAHNEISQNNVRLKELEEKANEIKALKNKFDLEISEKEKQFTDLRLLKLKLETASEKKKRVDDLLNLNKSLQEDSVLLERHSESLKFSIIEFSKFENLYGLKQRELKEARMQEKIVEIKDAELKKEIEIFSIQIQEIKGKIAKAEELKSKTDYISELEMWLSKKFASLMSAVETNVMIKLKLEFSKLFQEWFSMLVSESFNIRLREDFTPIIEQQDYEIDYSHLSGGERTAIALAYRLSLNQVINSLMSKIKTKDLVILDEPTDGFSDQQLDKMREVLDELNVAQLIVVSHEQKIESFVENVIRFKKENGISVRVS